MFPFNFFVPDYYKNNATAISINTLFFELPPPYIRNILLHFCYLFSGLISFPEKLMSKC